MQFTTLLTHTHPSPQLSPSFKLNRKNLNEIGDVLYDCSKKSLVAGLIGYILKTTFHSPFALPFFGIGASLGMTRLVVKVTDLYNPATLKGAKEEVCKLIKLYPRLQMITFLFMLVITGISPLSGLIVAIALGILAGLTIEVEQCKMKQENKSHYFTKIQQT